MSLHLVHDVFFFLQESEEFSAQRTRLKYLMSIIFNIKTGLILFWTSLHHRSGTLAQIIVNTIPQMLVEALSFMKPGSLSPIKTHLVHHSPTEPH